MAELGHTLLLSDDWDLILLCACMCARVDLCARVVLHDILNNKINVTCYKIRRALSDGASRW